MYLYFVDDTNPRKCSRNGVRELVGIGGILVPASVARDLDDELTRICTEFGFPSGEVFKWSPSPGYWMQDNLKDQRRTDFFSAVLRAARERGARAQVAIVEPNWGRAAAKTPIMDAMTLALERFDNFLTGERQNGIVIAAQPGGGPKDERKLLAECLAMLSTGTAYAGLRRIATNVVTMPFKQSRLLQAADLVISGSAALVAGSPHAAPLVQEIRPMLRANGHGCVGGVGMKLHPDACYVNLYHWLWGDVVFEKMGKRFLLPWTGKPYERSPDQY